jgi:hypothetical protein
MEKTQRTIAGLVAYYCKLSAILISVLFASTNVASSQCAMTCHNINLSLDTIIGGKTTLAPENVMSNGLGSCPGGQFVLKMYDPFGNSIGNMVDCQWVGYTLIVKVTDQISGNSCWSKVKVEDKSGPNITCGKDTISCLALNSYSQGLDKFPLGKATDNCSVNKPVTIALICTDLPCSDPNFVATCIRTVIATDQWGLTSQCKDSLWISKDSLKNLVGPRDTMLECSIADTIAKDANGNPIPQRVGVPTIKGFPVWPNHSACKIISRYSDLVYPICGKSRKIRRQWTVTDWCTKKDTVVLQWIKITDNTPPSVGNLPAPITVSAGAHDCNTPVTLTKPSASDCSGIQSVNYSAVIFSQGYGNGLPTILSGTFVGNYITLYLPAGTDTIKYIIADSCSNRTELVQVVNVIDAIPPTPVCDQRTTTTLDPAQCWARVYAADLDNGSHDNCCSELYFAAIQMDTLTKYQQLLINKVKSKYGEGVYNSKRSLFDLIIDKYINCAYFNDYIDLGDCGDKQVVLRVHEACKIPLYDPHVHGDSKHSFYCKAAYSNQYGIGYSNDLGTIQEFIKNLLSSAPGWVDLNLNIAAKNYNDCMVWINVQDKQAPTCKVEPIKYAYCDGVPYATPASVYNQGWDLGICQGNANGIYDTAYLKLDKYDTGSKTDPSAQFDQAEFKDNCGEVKVTSTTSGGVNNCGAGTLTRTWTGTDKCGQLSTTCSQKLVMLHRSDFEVLFPKDIETDCLDKISQFDHPTGDLYPKIFDDDCEQVGISFEDTRYEIAHDACFKIIRVWKLIDWCSYDPDQTKRYKDYIVDTASGFRANTDPTNSRYCTFRYLKDNNDGYITYTQIIKVINKIAPTVVKVDSVVTCADNAATCLGHVKLKMSGSDDCTSPSELKWNILIDSLNDGTVNRVIETTGATATLDGDFQVGKHKITFVLRDLCGNETSRTSVVDVRLCKKPTPYLLNGLAVDLMPLDNNKDGKPDAGMVVIWAKDFDAGSYASCGQKLVAYSFSSDTTKKSITYTCDSLGQRFVNVWVTDSYGNQDFARTYILIQDNNKACTGGVQAATTANINGLIKTDEKLQVENVNVSLDGSNAIPSITKSDGVYAFSNMQVGGSYKVMPKKNINPMNGVSTLDLLLIQKHILGVQNLSNPYRMIAADINKSNDITSVDLVELRKLILGIYDNFQGNESWRFVPSNYNFKNATNPFDGGFPEYHTINQFTQNTSADFIGIKTGDVNGSVSPNQLMGGEVRSPGKELIMYTQEQLFKAHDMIEVPIYMNSTEAIQGYQYTISFDINALEFIEATPVNPEMSKANFGTTKISQGLVTTSFATLHPISKPDKALYVLHFKALKPGQLSDLMRINSKVTVAEAYNTTSEVISVRLAVQSATSGMSYALLQNQPNPFQQLTKIGFSLPEGGKANITIFDLSGKALKSISGQYQRGYNEVMISRSELQASGVFYYQLQTTGFSATRKMIVLE